MFQRECLVLPSFTLKAWSEIEIQTIEGRIESYQKIIEDLDFAKSHLVMLANLLKNNKIEDNPIDFPDHYISRCVIRLSYGFYSTSLEISKLGERLPQHNQDFKKDPFTPESYNQLARDFEFISYKIFLVSELLERTSYKDLDIAGAEKWKTLLILESNYIDSFISKLSRLVQQAEKYKEKDIPMNVESVLK